MRKSLIYLLFTTITLNSFSCNGQDVKSVQQQLNKDSSRKIIDLNLSGMLKGVSDVEVFDLADDTLYLINKDKLLQFDVKTGSVMLNEKISSFLTTQFKEKKYAKKVIVRKNHFYISFFNELYDVSKNGEAKKIYKGSYSINDFNIGKSEILIASRDTIKTIDFKGKVLSSLFFDFTDAGFIKSSEGIFYSATPDDDIHGFYSEKGIIKAKIYSPLSLNAEIKEPFVSYATDKYFVGFDYWKRTALYILMKGEKKHELVKTINLKDLDYKPSQAEIQKEEGQPNFKIAFDRGTYYVIALGKGKLKIKPFTL